MASKPTVELSGFDDLFITIDRRFNTKMDQLFFAKTNSVIKQIDFAASKVFSAMASGASVQGYQALPVMGRYASLPSFLAEYTEPWEPLTKEYVRRKKRYNEIKGIEARPNTFWQYKGQLKQYFQEHSAKLVRDSNNAMMNNTSQQYTNPANKETMFTQAWKDKNAALKMMPGYKSKAAGMYDIEYSPKGDRNVKASYTKASPNYGTPVSAQTLSAIRRSVRFDLFRGLQLHLEAMQGKRHSASPEEYISGIQMGDSKGIRMQQINKGTHYMAPDGSVVVRKDFNNTGIGIKLHYRKKDGVTRSRPLITPYMRYYAKKVLVPLSKKLISQGIK